MGTIPHRQYVHPAGAQQQDESHPMADGQYYALCETLVLAHNGHAGGYARRPILRPKAAPITVQFSNLCLVFVFPFFIFTRWPATCLFVNIFLTKHF